VTKVQNVDINIGHNFLVWESTILAISSWPCRNFSIFLVVSIILVLDVHIRYWAIFKACSWLVWTCLCLGYAPTCLCLGEHLRWFWIKLSRTWHTLLFELLLTIKCLSILNDTRLNYYPPIDVIMWKIILPLGRL